jgi:hypothetical protein
MRRLVLSSSKQDMTSRNIAAHSEKFISYLIAHLRDVLTAGELREKFAAFTHWAQLGAEEDRAYHALQAHAEQQRITYEERPVLGTQPFSLCDIYVSTGCGLLTWQEIRGKEGKPETKRDAFLESDETGGRRDLLQTVLEYMKKPRFNDAIVIQGGPGAGKSAFTLHLTDQLLREGLCPLRIRLRDLDVQMPLLDALSKALLEPDEIGVGEQPAPKPENALLHGKVFDEGMNFGEAIISPYVLILDGWDEVSTAGEGFRIQVSRLLQRVREELLRPRNPLIRVIITGRPSEAVADSTFLAGKTPVLTMRPYTPEQLELYARRLQYLLQHPTVLRSKADGEQMETWCISSLDFLAPVFTRYRKEFVRSQQGKGAAEGLDVLGQPLLAHLALRVIADCSRQQDLAAMLDNPTLLYRSLVDLTCAKAGKAAFDSGDTPAQARIRGIELRGILHRTAAAITATGHESIPFEELTLRARLRGDEKQSLAQRARQDRPWTRLMISFYFKGGGEHHGCEFLHKTFREYLFAEGIVETLKAQARKQTSVVERRHPDLYWEDFPQSRPGDQRFELSRALGELASPQRITPETAGHLDALLQWELARSSAQYTETPELGEATEKLSLEKWETVRDLLAEMWDWWARGVHLRPQPRQDESDGKVTLDPPYADRLVDLAMTRDRHGLYKNIPIPPRTTTMDSYLGEVLFRLAALVHYYVARQQGWLGWADKSSLQADHPESAFMNLRRSQKVDWLAARS